MSFGVITLVFVLTCPLSYLMINIFGIFGLRPLGFVLRSLQLSFSTRLAISYIVLAIFCLFLNAVTMPFWQATKAVLYYSLRSRREGFDLQIREGE